MPLLIHAIARILSNYFFKLLSFKWFVPHLMEKSIYIYMYIHIHIYILSKLLDIITTHNTIYTKFYYFQRTFVNIASFSLEKNFKR